MSKVENLEVSAAIGGPQKFYITADGVFQGSVSSPPDNWDFYDVPETWIEVPTCPEYSDQLWLFPGWGPSPSQLRAVEDAWRETQLVIIANQLLAIEEAEAAAEEGEDPPEDLLPGTRNQWLSYRTKVRAWKVGNVNFPNSALRPVQPT